MKKFESKEENPISARVTDFLKRYENPDPQSLEEAQSLKKKFSLLFDDKNIEEDDWIKLLNWTQDTKQNKYMRLATLLRAKERDGSLSGLRGGESELAELMEELGIKSIE